MSGSSKPLLSSPAPYQLHTLVLDYLCHCCYTRTAAALRRDNPIRQLDADGDEILVDADSEESGNALPESFETLLRQIKLRQEIRERILSGRVDDAIALLNTHFPSVLAENIIPSPQQKEHSSSSGSDSVEYVSSTSTEPAHLLLNLRILAFSEACRTVPLDYPPKLGTVDPSSDPASPVMIPKLEESPGQEALITRARKLYAFCNTLSNPQERATYVKEVENVSGLLAYEFPEKSAVAKYLSMERREAVADQIDRAILRSTGQPLVSSLELITRHTHLLWHYAHQHGVKARPGAVLPPKSGKSAAGEGETEIVPPFDLEKLLDIKP
ncbi:unnamed protein product [Cyclocybe aegerita]|uniref:CTLH domain-containing protein n=1 Tax=Cyclocybe aegerita TaxID=1973307 RepID=A0A8S0W5T5_CYCAE|nr:unnamed protein product [Cyclocybe aegerita]